MKANKPNKTQISGALNKHSKSVVVSQPPADKLKKTVQMQYYKPQEPIRPICIKGPESPALVDARVITIYKELPK
jgi:hypothetical protein